MIREGEDISTHPPAGIAPTKVVLLLHKFKLAGVAVSKFHIV